MSPEPGQLLALGLDAARAAASVHRQRDTGTIDTKSTGTDMVSEVDRRAEAVIVERLLGARPDDGLLGEEGSERDGSSGVRWVIDPLDGTTNYLYGFAPWAVSIAAEVDGTVVAGVVLDSSRDEVFTAALGGGARRDGRDLRLAAPPSLDRALVATGFGYAPARRAAQAELLVGVIPHVRDVRRAGSAAVDLCSVAAGRVDAYYELGLAPWDLAAGTLVASEAGAAVATRADGTHVVAHPDLLDPLLALLEAGDPR